MTNAERAKNDIFKKYGKGVTPQGVGQTADASSPVTSANAADKLGDTTAQGGVKSTKAADAARRIIEKYSKPTAQKSAERETQIAAGTGLTGEIAGTDKLKSALSKIMSSPDYYRRRLDSLNAQIKEKQKNVPSPTWGGTFTGSALSAVKAGTQDREARARELRELKELKEQRANVKNEYNARLEAELKEKRDREAQEKAEKIANYSTPSPEDITTETAGDWIEKAAILAEKPDWTDEDKLVAGRMLSALGGKNIGERAKNTLKGGNKYLNSLSMNDVPGDELRAYEIYDSLYSRYHNKAAAVGHGLMKGLGVESALKTFNTLLGKSDNPTVKAAAALEDSELNRYERQTELLKNDAPGAYRLGDAAGTMALMSSIASGIGSVEGFASLPEIARSAISGAGSFGLGTAYKELGEAASGEKTWGDYVKDVAVNAASGAAGGALSGAIGKAGLKILKDKNLLSNSLARAAVAGTAGSGYAAGSAAVSETASYMRDKDNYRFNFEDVAERILVGFAFGAIGSLTKNYTADPNAAAQMDIDDALAEKYFGGMSQSDAHKAYRAFAKEYSDVINFTGGKDSMTPDMLTRYNTLQEINRAYDRFVILSGTRAYNKTRTAKATNDAEVYAQGAKEFENTVSVIKGMASEPGSAINPEAVQILEAVQNGMTATQPAINANADNIPAAAVQTMMQSEPANIELPTVDEKYSAAKTQRNDESILNAASDRGEAIVLPRYGANMTLPTAGENDIITKESKGATEYDGGSLSVGDGGRNTGESSGEQTRRMGGSAEKSAAFNQARRAVEVQNLTKNLRLEKQSSKELGLRNGTESRETYLIPRENWTDYMREADARAYTETGKHAEFVSGQIQVISAAGTLMNARAARTDGGYIIRADHSRYSVDQLLDHEMYHDKAMSTPGLDAAMEERIIERFTRKEFERVLGKYMEKLQGTYDKLTEYSSGDEIEEAAAKIKQELFADAYAGINAFGAGADRFAETAGEVTREYGVARESRENAAAMDRKSGPPEVYSLDAEKSEKLAQALEILDRGGTGTEVYNETGLVVMANGNIRDGMLGDVIWRNDNGRSDEGRIYNSGKGARPGEVYGRSDRGLLEKYSSETGGRSALAEWDSLAEGDRRKITSAVSERMERATAEGAEILDRYGSTEAFAEKFYSMLRQGRAVAEQWVNIVPDAVRLMDEIESISEGVTKDITGRNDNGRNDEGRIRDSAESIRSGEIYGRSARSRLGRNTAAESGEKSALAEWDSLAEGDRRKITSAVSERMEHATDEGLWLLDKYGGATAFAEKFYSMLRQGRIVAEQWTGFIPDAEGLMDEIESISEGDIYSVDDDEPTGVIELEDGARLYPNGQKVTPSGNIVLPSEMGRQEWTERRSAAKAEQAERSKQKNIEYLKERIEMLSDVEYQKRLLDKGGMDTLRDNEKQIKNLQNRIDRLSGKTQKTKPMTAKMAAAVNEELRSPTTEPAAPTQAKRELKNEMFALFGIPNNAKQTAAQVIYNAAENALKDGKLGYEEQRRLFDKLYSMGEMTVEAPGEYRAVRNALKNETIYVSPSVKAEFADGDYNALRKRAFRAGVYLVNDNKQMGVDGYLQYMSEMFPGFFDRSETDLRRGLENIVQLAEDGMEEKMSLSEYADYINRTEGMTQDESLDLLERRFEQSIEAFADKARFEVELKNKTNMRLAQDRAERREAMRRQQERKALGEIQQKTLKQLQWLGKNRDKAPAELKEKFDEILSDIDLFAVSIADEAHWSSKYEASWKDIAELYTAARENDPNFLPSKELEMIVHRLRDRKIGEMDLETVSSLYKAAVGLRTEYYNRNNVINDEQHRLFSEVYDSATSDLKKAGKGFSKNPLDKFFNHEQLTPTNVLKRMGGWKKDSAWGSMVEQLEKGERDKRAFFTEAQEYIAEFAKENKAWLKKADGQGRDGIWYELEVPELLELKMGHKPMFGDTVTIYMTPLQKVHMYLESKNHDNLRHMTGGRTFADKALYSKGERQEAFSKGKTIRLAPETVKAITADLTEEERELAELLEGFYNKKSKDSINKVSNVLYGYDKAIGKNYAPIFTNKNYVGGEFGVFDVTAEGVGNLKERQVSLTPSLNISALDAFDKHIDQTSRFVGFAIPVRNWNTLINWYGNGTTMKETIGRAWDKKSLDYIENLINTLQSGSAENRGSVEKFIDKTLSKYVSATFGFNPGIVFKQAASYPQAAAVLGWRNMPGAHKLIRTNRELIGKYTKELDYRTLGYATPETALLRDNPSKLGTNKAYKFMFGGDAIIAMDAATVKRIWPWAENYVRHEFVDLEVGTQEQIDAGESPFYRKVAEVFNDAVSTTQPMYDVMHRAEIMQHRGARAFTMFKTVPLQQYNTLRRNFGELSAAKQAYKEAKTDYAKAEAKKEYRRAARRAAGAVTATITSIAMLEGVEFLNQLLKNRAKKYRNDDGDLTAESSFTRLSINAMEDAAGMVIAGKEVSEILASIFINEKWYGISMPGGEQLNDIIDRIGKNGEAIIKMIDEGSEIARNGGNLKEYFKRKGPDYAGALKDTLELAATYIPGFPLGNMEKYLMGVMQNVSPELYTAMQDVFDAPVKSDLKGLDNGQLEMRISNIFDDRGVQISDEAEKMLALLYAAGYDTVVPSNLPKKITVNEEERELGAYQQQTYSVMWTRTVEAELNKLVRSRDFRLMSNDERAAELKLLYDYGTEKAKKSVFPDYEPKYQKITETMKSGLQWVDAAQVYMKQKESMTSAELCKWLDEQDYTDKQTKAIKEVYNIYSKDYEAYTALGIGSEDAYEIVSALEELKPAKGSDGVTIEQKYKAVKKLDISDKSKKKAYGELLSRDLGNSKYKADIAREYDVDASEFIEFKIVLPKYDEDQNGSYKQAEIEAALRAMEGLTNEERAALWQLQTGSTSSKNNPFDRSVGDAVIYAKQAAKGK